MPDPAGAARADAAQSAGPPAEPRRRTSRRRRCRRPSTSACAAAARRSARVDADDIAAFVDLAGLGAGEYSLTVHADASRDAGVTRIEPGSRFRCGSTSGKTDDPRLFGTDGVRGTAGHAIRSIRRPSAGSARRSCARCRTAAGSPQLLVGRDTRESGAWIEAELAHGASGEGASVTSAGVVPTPAVAYLTRTDGYDAGVVISASHNPYEDNGIKVFSGTGEKFTERVEREVEAIVADASWSAPSGDAGDVPRADLVDAYLDHLRAVFPESRRRSATFAIAIDCANGATTTVAPELFSSLGFETIVIGNQPDGRNINLDCGSTHPERLAETVVERGCQMGVAFDGDGDRAIFVDHRGQIVDGDAVLLMCGRQLQREGRLRGNAIVATVMSNIGLELALQRARHRARAHARSATST